MKQIVFATLAAAAVLGAATPALAQLPGAPIPSVGGHFEIQGVLAKKTGEDFEDSKLGYGGNVLLGPTIGGTALLGMVGYSVIPFDAPGVGGSGGDDRLLKIGGHARFRLGAPLVPVSPWFGVTGAYVRETSREDNATGEDPSATGWEFGAHLGLAVSRITAFVGASYLNMGDFTADGVLVFLGNGGLVLSGGVGLRLF